MTLMLDRPSKARRLLFVVALAAFSRPGQGAQAVPVRDLSTFFQVGSAVLDLNGDTFADASNVRIVLPPSPTAAQITAAANIAARLGLETTALDLPLKRGPGPGIAVSVATTLGPDAASLGDDEGLVRLTPGPPAALHVGGRTDQGVMAAGEYVAARLPFAWDVKGATLDRITGDVRDA